MNADRLIAYVGDAALHDGTITTVDKQVGRLTVVVQSQTGTLLRIEFRGVHNVCSNRPVGMLLYALAEMETTERGRKFVFANWDEQDDATLELHADDFTISSGDN